MTIKIIAVGNTMMGDDGIAVYALECIRSRVEELGMEAIVGETDIDYCISQIAEDDELIIIDASCRGGESGSVNSIALHEAVCASSNNSWQHDRDIIRELKIRKLCVSGLLICIEVSDIDYRWGLSDKAQEILPIICNHIYDLILKYRGE